MIGTLLLIPSIFLRGYVITMMWLWFIMPIFNVSELTIGYAIGLSSFVAFLTMQNVKSKGEKFSEAIVQGIVVSLVSWGISAIIHFLIQHPMIG